MEDYISVSLARRRRTIVSLETNYFIHKLFYVTEHDIKILQDRPSNNKIKVGLSTSVRQKLISRNDQG